ncbi:MAG: exo-alpha-sialidase [Ignavibacteriae bacterium]|nr:exo-alpha-sialidase [Ignavibacteria bacterium]MBI3365833.1 exo-alpha-sialidase [Ignavibacteriota bacterium]
MYKKATVFLLCIVTLSALAVTAGNIVVAQGRNARTDSLFQMPHERYFEQHLAQPPLSILTPKERTFTPSAVPFPNVNISGDTAPQNEPSVRISHKDPNRAVAAWRDFRTGVNPAIRRVGYSFTTDGGTTWSQSQLLPLIYQDAGYPRTSDPAVCVDTSGLFYIATISIDNNNGRGKIIVYRQNPFLDLFDQAFFAPLDTALNDFDDKEYIVCDLSPTSPYVNTLYISWTGFRSVGGGMLLTKSTNQGATWSHSVIINDPGNSGQGSDPCVRPNGDVCVVWAGGPGIMFDKSTDGGSTFGVDRLIDTAPGGGGGLAGFPSIATDLTNGPRQGYLYTVWSDSRNGNLDVFLRSSSDGGVTWSAARRVNDDPIGNAKDQFWPWIAVDDRGVISIVYYDTRLTSDNSITYTFLAHSWDGGITFTNRLISTAQSPRNTPNPAVRYGDYIGLDSWGKHTIPVWTDERAGGFDMDIYTAVMDTLPRANLATVRFPVRSGWNIVSVPVNGITGVTPYLFPTATLPAFAYEGTYVQKDTLTQGFGYWLSFPAETIVQIAGDSIRQGSIPVHDGWNLIGGITTSLPSGAIASDPPGMITSPFFTYTGIYVHSDSILPGRGYWVKVSGNGTLILSETAVALASNRIHIVSSEEVPPAAPGDRQSTLARIPTSYALEQNYPNPFNPETHFRFMSSTRKCNTPGENLLFLEYGTYTTVSSTVS